MVSIEEMASALEKASFMEGYTEVFVLKNGLVIAISGSEENMTLEVCDSEGNTKEVLCVLGPENNWYSIAKLIKRYLTKHKTDIEYVTEWADEIESVGSFDRMYNETINSLKNENERKFEFCLQKLNEKGTGTVNEFKTVAEFGETGHDAYAKVRESNPGWRVYTWGIFEEGTQEDLDKEEDVSLSWSVDFEVLKNGEEVDFFDLDEVDQEYILGQIKEGYNNGLV